MTANRGRLTAALLLSGLLHGLVLAITPDTRQPPPEVRRAGQLSILLVQAEGEKESEAKTDASGRPSEKHPRKTGEPFESPRLSTTEPSPRPPIVAEPRPAAPTGQTSRQTHAVDNSPSVEPASPPNSRTARVETNEAPVQQMPSADVGASKSVAGTRQAVQARLQERLAQHFHYPHRARRRGWEGEVLLSLRVDPHGEIGAVEVLKSSGRSLLDNAALDAVSKVSHLPEASDWLNGRDLRLELPVIYRLKEG